MKTKNELLKTQINSLLKESESLNYELRNIGFNNLNYFDAQQKHGVRIMAIEMRMDNLLFQITDD